MEELGILAPPWLIHNKPRSANDIAAPDLTMESVIGRHILQSWLTDLRTFGSPLSRRDWVLVQCSALLYGGRLLVQLAQRALDRYAPDAARA